LAKAGWEIIVYFGHLVFRNISKSERMPN